MCDEICFSSKFLQGDTMKKIVLQLFLIVGLTAFYGCGEEDPSTGSFGSGTAVVPPTVTKPVESNPDEVIPSTVIDPVTDPVTDIINVVSRTAKSTEQKGVFIDTLVKGLTVVQYNESGEVLETDDSEAKTTASDGTFVVLDGSVEIEFKIGDNLSVGRAKTNLFSTADGKDSAETIVTIVDLFNTESIYDWKNEQWTVPVNLMVTKVVKLGSQLVSVGGGVTYWAEAPETGPEGWGARIIFTMIFPK